MRIELSCITNRFGQATVLRDIELVLASGSLTVLCGQTGSGKSTLLQVAGGLEPYDHGTIEYFSIPRQDLRQNGRQVGGKLSPKAARERIGIVFQMPEDQLFAGTVREDIEYGLKLRKVPVSERLSRAETALMMVGLDPAEFLDRSPFLLSGGEKRRVAIAGALALQPEALLLDEPTAGLDPEAAAAIRDILVKLRDGGMTVLAATHDLDLLLPIGDQAAVMQQGMLVYTGEPRELIREPAVLHAAGLELPAAVAISHRLSQLGLRVSPALSIEELLPALETAAHAANHALHADIQDQTGKAEAPLITRSAQDQTDDTETDAADAFRNEDASLLERLDPRAKWLGTVVLSIAILGISNLWGLAASIALLSAFLRLGRISLKRVLRLLRPFLVMFLFLWLIGALSFSQADIWLGPIGFSWKGAARSGLGVGRFLLVIILGIVFSESTTGSPLREGLEWMIRPLRKAGVPTRDISLAVTIAVQFVPWILERIWQLKKALRSRGQDTIGIRRFTLGQLYVLLVPLMISLLKMGDELATAIESRGYSRQAERTSWYKLVWTWKDTAACLLACVAAALLLARG